MSVLLRAFVVGYTGETGKALVKALAKDPRYGDVKLIGRRDVEVEYGIDAELAAKKFSKHTVDFDKLDEHQLVFADTDVGFSTLGTTMKKSGKEQMRIIDHDYTIKVAELALASGCKELHVVTSKGANPKSSVFYLRLKGEIEADLRSSCVFPNFLAVYRPALLLSDRAESRLGENIAKFIMKPIASLYPNWISTQVELLAKAMANAPFCLASLMHRRSLNKSVTGDDFDPKFLVVENCLLPELAADSEPILAASEPQ